MAGARRWRQGRHPCTVTSDIDKYPRAYETAEATQYQPTIDQVIADAIHTNEPKKSLETGILDYVGSSDGVVMGTVSKNLAHRGPYDFLPPERDPTQLFNNLFKAGVSPGMDPGIPLDISAKLRKSVLDTVLGDANRLKPSTRTWMASARSSSTSERWVPATAAPAAARLRCRPRPRWPT